MDSESEESERDGQREGKERAIVLKSTGALEPPTLLCPVLGHISQPLCAPVFSPVKSG